MSKIPAASLVDVDLNRIRLANPDYADEIEQLGKLLVSGELTDADFLKLCERLFEVGERTQAEQLLVASAKAGDPTHDLHRHLFPNAQNEYDTSLRTFSLQFGVTLTSRFSYRLYSSIFRCSILPPDHQPRHELSKLLIYPCEAQINYFSQGWIEADVYVVPDPDTVSISPDCSSSLRYLGNRWVVERSTNTKDKMREE